MATRIQKIMELPPPCRLYVWRLALTRQGLNAKGQYAYMKSGWLNRTSKGVYVLSGTTPKLLHAISAYNNQLPKQCIVGAYTALELRGYSHYLSVIGQTASLSIYRKNKQASLVDAVSRLGHDGEVYDYFFSGG